MRYSSIGPGRGRARGRTGPGARRRRRPRRRGRRSRRPVRPRAPDGGLALRRERGKQVEDREAGGQLGLGVALDHHARRRPTVAPSSAGGRPAAVEAHGSRARRAAPSPSRRVGRRSASAAQAASRSTRAQPVRRRPTRSRAATAIPRSGRPPRATRRSGVRRRTSSRTPPPRGGAASGSPPASTTAGPSARRARACGRTAGGERGAMRRAPSSDEHAGAQVEQAAVVRSARNRPRSSRGPVRPREQVARAGVDAADHEERGRRGGVLLPRAPGTRSGRWRARRATRRPARRRPSGSVTTQAGSASIRAPAARPAGRSWPSRSPNSATDRRRGGPPRRARRRAPRRPRPHGPGQRGHQHQGVAARHAADRAELVARRSGRGRR